MSIKCAVHLITDVGLEVINKITIVPDQQRSGTANSTAIVQKKRFDIFL